MNFTIKQLPAQAITPEAFRPYGQVITVIADGKGFDGSDAQLQLEGIPRFYLMRLHRRGRSFARITRHQRCTQCLGALNGKEWLIAVAPPSQADHPEIEAIVAFRIPGNWFIKLDIGTWHAGPYFDLEWIDFYNLELSDTNITDHHTVDLSQSGWQFEIV